MMGVAIDLRNPPSQVSAFIICLLGTRVIYGQCHVSQRHMSKTDPHSRNCQIAYLNINKARIRRGL